MKDEQVDENDVDEDDVDEEEEEDDDDDDDVAANNFEHEQNEFDVFDKNKLDPVDRLFWDEKEFGSNGRWADLNFSPKDFLDDYEKKMATQTLEDLQISPRTGKVLFE